MTQFKKTINYADYFLPKGKSCQKILVRLFEGRGRSGVSTAINAKRTLNPKRLQTIVEARHSCLVVKTDTSRVSEGRPPRPLPTPQGSVYRQAPEAPLFNRMPTGPKAFLEPSAVCGLRHGVWFPH